MLEDLIQSVGNLIIFGGKRASERTCEWTARQSESMTTHSVTFYKRMLMAICSHSLFA